MGELETSVKSIMVRGMISEVLLKNLEICMSTLLSPSMD